MILKKNNGYANVYSLCGVLPSNIEETKNHDSMLPFPNPVNHLITIPYQLPDGEQTGTIRIIDSSGREIESLNVGNYFREITYSTEKLVPGIYYYYLVSSKGNSEPMKFVKARL